MNPPIVQTISECFIKPQYPSEKPSHPPVYLAPFDLSMLSMQYIQKGLLFTKPTPTNDQENPVQTLLEKLKESMSLTLAHFYPLAGRLATYKQENPCSYFVCIDCNDSPGAKLIHATADLTVADILSPIDVPVVVQSFFEHGRAVNHDGHAMSLLSIQVTELIDGIFVGCSINHVVADGTSYWQFFESLSNAFRAREKSFEISRPPVLTRWFPDGYGPIIDLPFSHHDEFIGRVQAPPNRARIFHFSSESVAELKRKANSECKTVDISSFQAVSALIWRCVTRVRSVPRDQETSCSMAANNRTRMDPPLPDEYFGNSVQLVKGKASAGELLEHGFGWAARRLHEALAGHCAAAVREYVEKWMEHPFMYVNGKFSGQFSLVMGWSTRFAMYECEFGMGRAVAIRSGYDTRFDGKVTFYPGNEGGGSMDVERQGKKKEKEKFLLSSHLGCIFKGDVLGFHV
ncbi:hypothetical protein RHGRI_021839 [Rhododendron griersonianum]|uniref:Uncharacterized protein n=1 Tax=Rhododendron griersonianum TaxID=479676 RepID=A0AAV6JLW1_9ERIC|nr:hypothetical protein RHGRI_021834 [Rhododendron griersonianum]KAG5542112.1 hypothetical protein RHGRI_021839 [Rhododendron griersonianum]